MLFGIEAHGIGYQWKMHWLLVQMYICAGQGGEPSGSFCSTEKWWGVNITMESPYFCHCVKLWYLGEGRKGASWHVVLYRFWSREPSMWIKWSPIRRQSTCGRLALCAQPAESLPPTLASALWVNGVWRRKGAVKGANLSLKWTFYRNPIFSGAQSQTDLVD